LGGALARFGFEEGGLALTFGFSAILSPLFLPRW
jgi:hypothetical protein